MRHQVPLPANEPQSKRLARALALEGTGRPERHFFKLGEMGAREFHEQLNLEESGLDPGHSEGDWFNVVCRQSVAPEIAPIQLINWSPQKIKKSC